jgi:hypothetical protein
MKRMLFDAFLSVLCLANEASWDWTEGWKVKGGFQKRIAFDGSGFSGQLYGKFLLA